LLRNPGWTAVIDEPAALPPDVATDVDAGVGVSPLQ
jgi:hypothetical protein